MKRKLGEILLSSGMVTQADIDLALDDQTAGEPGRLGDLLVALGRLTPAQLAEALSKQHGLPTIQLGEIEPEVRDAVPLAFQKERRLVPFRANGDDLFIAMADPGDTDAIDELKYSGTRRITVFVAPSDEIEAAIAAGEAPPPAPAVEFGAPGLDDLFSDLSDEPAAAPSMPAVPSVAPMKAAKPGLRAPAPPSPTADELFDYPSLGDAAPPPHASAPSSPFELSPPPSAPPVSGLHRAMTALAEPEPEIDISTNDLDDGPPAQSPQVPLGEGEDLPSWLTADADDLVPPSMRAARARESAVTQATATEAERALESIIDEPVAAQSSSPSSLDPDNLFADAVVDDPQGDVSEMLETGLEELNPEPESTENPLPEEERLADAPDLESPPPPPPPSAPPEQPAAVADPGWSGKLDDVQPSKLIVAAVKALIGQGVLSEDDVLRALGKK